MELFLEDNSQLHLNFEVNKLLVPSPVATYDEEDGTFLGYQQPDISFLSGITTSFSDAPGGFSEELKEITWAIGAEYVFQEAFAFRTGYFHESVQKGSRKFLTLGTGFALNYTQIDISYLFSTSKVRNPLENTLRFSLTFHLNGGLQNEEE